MIDPPMNRAHITRLSAAAVIVARREAESILSEVDGVHAVVIATADGFEIAAAHGRPVDVARIAALASSIAAIGEVVSAEAGLGRHRSLLVDTENGFAVVHNVQRSDINLVINAIASADALIGRVNHRTAEAARRLAES